MTREKIDVEELYLARDMLLSKIHELLNGKDRKFLPSVKSRTSNWTLFAYPANLPATQWKMHNISQMQSKKRDQSFIKLERILQQGPSRLGSGILWK